MAVFATFAIAIHAARAMYRQMGLLSAALSPAQTDVMAAAGPARYRSQMSFNTFANPWFLSYMPPA